MTTGTLARWLRLPSHNGFPSLWASLTVSVLGDQLTLVAIPTLAILNLGAGPLETGALAAAAWLAWPVLAIPAGVWVDRLSRRQVLVACDVIRALALAIVPLSAFTIGISIPVLLVVTAVAGMASVFAELAFNANVADLLPPADIPIANARLEASRATSYLAGPALAGLIVTAVGAATAIALDVLSFVTSAAFLLRTRRRPGGGSTGPGPSFRGEMAAGLTAIRKQPLVIRLAVAASVSNLGLMASRAVLLLFCYRVLRLDPAEAGVALSGAGVGALLGVAASGRLAARFGLWHVLVAATTLESAAFLLIPLSQLVSIPLLIVAPALAASSFWGVVWNVNAASVRQVVLPAAVQGRVIGIVRLVAYVVIPVGSIGGGLLAQSLGAIAGDAALPATICIGAIVGISSGLAFTDQSLRALRGWRFGDPVPRETASG